jgi:formate dehydrogenase major subunit
MEQVTVTINGNSITVDNGATILEAARKAGHDIPTFCHSENLKPFTSCFMCAVKVEGGKGNLVPSCATKVRDGMSVVVESEEIDAARKMCLNLILSDHCGDCVPPCEDACPSSIDIRGFLDLVAEGKEVEAASLIREKAPLPGVLGRVCPRPCEDACRRNRVDDAISICFMKRYIADSELEAEGTPVYPNPAPDTGKKVAVIGAGPAGMSAAYFLRLKGHAVTVFEAQEKSGGMLRWGIPYYRLPDAVLKQEFDPIEKLGVTVKYGTEIGKDSAAKELERDFDCLMIAIGAQGASSMRVEGEELAGVYSGIDYLAKLARDESPGLGDRVVVVGGGNTAIDVSRSAVRKGADVSIIYRRSRKQMPANDFEIEEALHEGVDIQYLVAPTKVERDGEELLVHCIRMELGAPDESGRRRPVPVEGTDFTIRATSVISAIGQRVLSGCIDDLGVDKTRWGTIVADENTLMTSRPGIFSFGDCQTGADIAVRAVGNARRAAVAADQYLRGEEVTGEPVLFNSSMGRLDQVDEAVFEGYEQKERVSMPVIPDKERTTTFNEIETGFGPEPAREEAKRCLKCGCDAADDCRLRDYATRYGADQSLFTGERRSYRLDDSHEKIKMEIHKCISCGSCVRACAEVKGLDVFSFVGRGFTTRMEAPFGRSLVNTACDGCGECVKVCPTAALMEKNSKTETA